MQITLRPKVDGKRQERIYTLEYATGYHFRKVAEFDEKIDYSKITIKEMDELIGFVCDVFDDQFTVDEFYEGIPSHKVVSTISDLFVYIRTGKTSEELAKEFNERLQEGNEQGK